MSNMHNPPHPGEVLREWIPKNMTVTSAAKALKISRVSLSKILNGNTNISAEMAIRLSQWLGTSSDVWLSMQVKYDLWHAEQKATFHIERLAA
jgi:addiction module HigA family antidote